MPALRGTGTPAAARIGEAFLVRPLESPRPPCPERYAELGLAEQRRYLPEAYGIDYDDWYRETQVESAMGWSSAAPPIQLYLAGMGPAPDFQLESF